MPAKKVNQSVRKGVRTGGNVPKTGSQKAASAARAQSAVQTQRMINLARKQAGKK